MAMILGAVRLLSLTRLLALVQKALLLIGITWFGYKLEKNGAVDAAATAAGQVAGGVGNTAQAIGSGAQAADKTAQLLAGTPGGTIWLAVLAGAVFVLFVRGR